MATRHEVEQTIAGFLVRAKKTAPYDLDTPLYADGIGLDSLEAAELSAVLEDSFGSDPYTEGLVPQSVGEILEFYAGAAAGLDER